MSTKMNVSWLYEKRPLKKPKLGPPDVYPQDPKQKEDELTHINVKQGFLTHPAIVEEYGSARNSNITASKFGSFFSALLSKKQELNTFQDSGRKKPQVATKDNVWLVTARSKNSVDQWFKDLTTNSKTLTQLGRKFPIFNKKEEIFLQLYDSQVPMFKACWFIKTSSSYSIAMSESSNKSKKRQLPDPSQEWTSAFSKYLRELYQKLSESYHASPSAAPTGVAPSVPPIASPTTVNVDVVYKQWQYGTQLAHYLFEEGLLDKHEFLAWVLDLLEKIKSPDDPLLRVVMPLLLVHAEDFCQSELLSRRLAYHCAKKLSQLVNDNMEKSSNAPEAAADSQNQSQANNQNSPSQKPPINPLVSTFQDLLTCPHHRSVVYGFSSVIQVITIRCPTALVWHNIGEGRTSPALNGSPLDHLPCAPSQLPMPSKPGNTSLRQELRDAEEEICGRSKAVEMKWCIERLQQATPGLTINKLLNALDALDRHCFGKIESSNSIETLYSKVFSNVTNVLANVSAAEAAAKVTEILAEDEPIVKLLCEWAVTSKRAGEHRAMVVAKLLEKRQSELSLEKETEVEKEEKEADGKESANNLTSNSNANEAALATQFPVFQGLLMSFLDTSAPVLDESNPTGENKLAFANLVLLFGELIRCDVFAHDAYMCTLISRGQFANSPATSSISSHTLESKTASLVEPSLTRFVPNLSAPPNIPSLGVTNQNMGVSLDANNPHRTAEQSLPMFEPVTDCHGRVDQPTLSWDIDMGNQQMDMDDARIDADLDKLLQHIKEGQQNNMNDQTDIASAFDGSGVNSMCMKIFKNDILLPDSVSSDKEDEAALGNAFPGSEAMAKKAVQRHLIYTKHFPLPQDESTSHDCNQRHVLLYGVGKARDDARHAVKKVTKEILKLFNRKSSMDISEGGKIKKPAIKEGFNFEAALTKFQSLSYFDQHVVISSCSTACIEMFNGVAAGTANYIPLIESIAFLFDLMEISLNVHGLIDFVIQLLKEMIEVELQLQQKCPILAGNYCTTIGLYIVGVLYRYDCCLLVSTEETFAVFDGLYKLVKHVTNPSDCSSAERCILCYLHDLYYSCIPLRSKYHDTCGALCAKVKLAIYATLQPSAVTLLWSTSCMIDYINNPKLKIDPNHVKQLNDNTPFRYSFVCNAVHAITSAREPNRLNEVSILCAELTSRCSVLSMEWLGVLKALCCSSNHNCGFIDVLTQVDVMDLTIHDNLAIFTSILIARRCFSLQDFIIHCAVPSILAASPVGGGGQDAEPGARLTCHLLLCLFRTSEPPLSSSVLLSTPATTLYSLTSPGPATLVANSVNAQQRSLYIIKHPCDRYLLAAAHSSMRVEAVLTVLKAILVLGDSNEGRETRTNSGGNQNNEISISEILGTMDDADFSDFGLPPFPGARPRMDNSFATESAGLGEFAKHALKQICSQEWVHERCLRDPETLSKQDLLLDDMLTHKQAQQLLQMICNPKTVQASTPDNEADQKQQISKVLHNLDEWTLRISFLQLQLMYAQCCASSDVSSWLDNVAKATIEFFQNASEENAKASHGNNGQSGGKSTPNKPPASQKNQSHEYFCGKDTRVWLVAPLISKLPSAVQGKILRVAANVLESGNWMSAGSANSSQNSYSYSKNKDRGFQQQKSSCSNTNTSSSTLLSHPPFLSLVLMCLKGQDEQRESLLNSLYSQLHQAVQADRPNDDIKVKQSIQEGLQLRISLVGGMFDMIQKSSSLMDWAVLLLQLISNGVVDPQLNYELFTTVLDMLAILIHTTQATDSSEPREETRKQYQNLIKKLKKELTSDRFGVGVTLVRQLLPIPKQQCEVITCEPMGSLIDTKGNKIAGFDSIDKKQGLQVAELQKVSPWDLLEGHKNPAPLSWTWFGAVKIERKPLRGEETHHFLAWHTHPQKKTTSYYLEPPPLPPEDVDPVPPPAVVPPPVEKPPIPVPLIPPTQGIIPMPLAEEALKREREADIGGRGMPKKVKPPRRRRQPKGAAAAAAAAAANVLPPAAPAAPSMRIPNSYDGYGGHGPPPPPPQANQQWYQGPQQPGPQHQGPAQQGYYHQGPLMGQAQRPNSKAVLNSILRARQPAAGGGGPPTQVVPNNVGGNPGGGPGQYMNQNPVNNPTAMANAGVPTSLAFQQRQQMVMQRQMRPQQPQQPPQPQPGPMTVNQNPMYQLQAGNAQPGAQMQQAQMHHMAPQNQQAYGGQPAMSYGNTLQMQAMEQMPTHSVNQPYSQQQPMMNPAMRAQLHQQQQQQHPHPHQHQQQFLSQRPQYVSAPNVTMTPMGPNQGYANPQGMQQMQQPNANGPPPMIRQAMQQQMLQRQLSSGKPQQHNPYPQGPY